MPNWLFVQAIIIALVLIATIVIYKRWQRQNDQRRLIPLVSYHAHDQLDQGHELRSINSGDSMNTDASTHTISDDKDALVRDLKSVLADADDLLTNVSDTTVEEFSAACTKVEQKINEARNRFAQTRTTATEKARCAAAATQEYIKHNPGKVAGAAIVVGLIAGILLARR